MRDVTSRRKARSRIPETPVDGLLYGDKLSPNCKWRSLPDQKKRQVGKKVCICFRVRSWPSPSQMIFIHTNDARLLPLAYSLSPIAQYVCRRILGLDCVFL